jgi:hypothetical protein
MNEKYSQAIINQVIKYLALYSIMCIHVILNEVKNLCFLVICSESNVNYYSP